MKGKLCGQSEQYLTRLEWDVTKYDLIMDKFTRQGKVVTLSK